MEDEYSKPLDEFPTFLSAISMASDDRAETIRGFVHAERKSPARYTPARQLFLRVLSHQLDYDAAWIQARRIAEPVDRDCAQQVLQVSETFLREQPKARIEPLSVEPIVMPNGKPLAVSPLWIRHLNDEPERLLVLHLWQSPLSEIKLAAAGAVVKRAVAYSASPYGGSEIDFISVSTPEHATGRRLQVYGWDRLKPLPEEKLNRFLERLCEAWTAYRAMPPRVVKKRESRTLFDH